jgi:hypothetical protein
MTEIKEVATVKDTPRSARVYFVGKNEHGEVHDALKAYEDKYHEKPVAAVLYRQYIYIPREKENGK